MAHGCLGPFFGKFHNELEDDEYADDDRPGAARQERSAEEAKSRRSFFSRIAPRSLGAGESARTGDFALKRHIKEFRVPHERTAEGPEGSTGGRYKKEQKVERLRVVNKSQRELPQSMMSNIFRQNKLHTIEIIRCRKQELPPFLNELERLTIINMSHNELRTFSSDLAMCKELKQIILEWNRISEIPTGLFTSREVVFAKLTVLNLAHNQLSVLPADFLKHTTNVLKLLDLSSNCLRSLPASITGCVLLQELDVSHNSLKQLPHPFSKTPMGKPTFQHLTKLFISFNELVALPEDIGECSNLTKIRMMDNRIRELPASILELWQVPGDLRRRDALRYGEAGKPGKLEEFLVEKNPLQMPSITSFQMEEGTPSGERKDAEQRRRPFDRAFDLFRQELERRAREQEELAHARAAVEDERGRLATSARSSPRGEATSQGAPAGTTTDAGGLGRHFVEPGMDDTELEDENGRIVSRGEATHLDPYWFGHCKGRSGRQQVVEIRNAESSILMLKRSAYIEKAFQISNDARNQALDTSRSSRRPSSRESPRTSAPDGLDDFKQHFVGTVPLQATDLYFSLLVYKMKPEFPSILAIFEQVISAPDMKYIVWDEWKRLILSNSMTFKDSVIHDMWLVMDFQRSGRVSLTDFIAAWHVHDVEISDPWIAQLAGTLRLDYYGMSAEEVQERLRGWDGRLDLAESGADTGLERLDAHSRRTDGRAETEDLPVQKAHRKALLDRVSLNETEYHEVGGSEDGDSDASLQSFELSEWSDEEVAFDAQAIRHRQREAENAMNSDLHKRRIIVDSDAAMKKLMELPPDEFNRQRDLQGMGEALALKQQAKKSNDTTFGGSSGVDAGAGVGNDTFAVRQSLREVYRSMPMPDFLGLVNLLLRGLQTIKHSQFNNDTYWHVRNPAFAHAMGTEGTNMYTRRLLMQMGFALINETYWVWPSAHLDMKATSSWGVCEVPYDCAGREPRRLDDMIELLKNCQKELRQNSTQFNGHFKITRE